MKLPIVAISLLFLLFGCSNANTSRPKQKARLSILQGLTTSDYTQISVVKPRNQGTYIYELTPKGGHLRRAIKSHKNSPWQVEHLFIGELKLGQQYMLKVKRQNGELIDSRSFATLNTNQGDIKIAVASCMDDSFKLVQKKMWESLLNKKAQLHLFVGDNVYGDKSVLQKGMARPSELWRRYAETRNQLEVFKSSHLTPTLATWDDHDYGNNGGGMNYPFKKESAKIFHSFFAQDPISSPVYKKGPGISFLFKTAKQNFYFLDNRSFRTNKKTKPDSHWGKEQETWLNNQLKKNQNFSWLVNGNQFFGAYQPFESYEKNHPTSFKKFLTQLKKIPTRVAFISGDRHLFEVMEIKKPDLNYSTIEITTSAIHAKLYPSSWEKNPNPRQLIGVAEKHNYAIIQSKSIAGGVSLILKGYGPGEQLIYKLNKLIE